MIDMEQALYDRIRPVLALWDEEDIYAVSFFVYANEDYRYGRFENVPTFEVSYNTESDCGGAGPRSEERWNYAYWRQDTTPIIDLDEPDALTKLLFDWFREQGIEDPGLEEEEDDGPVGFRALVHLAGNVARRLQDEGLLREKFGRDIPILIHDLEYTPCTLEATRHANPSGIADDFLSQDWEDADLDDMDAYIASSVREIFDDVIAKMTEHADEIKEEIIDEAEDLTEDKLDDFLKKLFGK